jgi:hypothetical protein
MCRSTLFSDRILVLPVYVVYVIKAPPRRRRDNVSDSPVRPLLRKCFFGYLNWIREYEGIFIYVKPIVLYEGLYDEKNIFLNLQKEKYLSRYWQNIHV